jgi:flagellar motor protein MotB
MRYSARKGRSSSESENPYWVSFSDLMAAMLVIFILATAALILELTDTKEQVEEDILKLRNAEQARKDILYEIKRELMKKSILVEVADNDSVLRIPENTLTFASNSFKIPQEPAIQAKIDEIGLTLHQAINKPFSMESPQFKRFEYLDTVFIEGHTDSQPSMRLKGNWGLSAFRAISLWQQWEQVLAVEPQFKDMVNAYGQNLFSVSGYAETRRVQLIEETAQQRSKNRRIDIRFTIKKPSISELEEVIP